MKNKYLFAIVILLIIGFGIFLAVGTKSNTTNAIKNNNISFGEIHEVTLSMKNGNYYPQVVEVKSGETVRIYLDKSVGGCYRSFTIRDFGIAKYLATEKDYVEFTPTQKGNFRFSCSMGMGTGTLVVK